MNATRLLDPATAAVNRAIEAVRYDRLDPADLSAVIAGLRELFWHTVTLTNALTHAYDTGGDLDHDNGGDPTVALMTIVAGLHTVAAQLADIDTALNETHRHAAHLYRRE
jgi:hypothetical protein